MKAEELIQRCDDVETYLRKRGLSCDVKVRFQTISNFIGQTTEAELDIYIDGERVVRRQSTNYVGLIWYLAGFQDAFTIFIK